MGIKDLNAGIFKKKYFVGDAFGEKKEDYFIELREPTAEEAVKLIPENGNNFTPEMYEAVGQCIIDHNVMVDDANGNEKKIDTKSLWKELKKRSGVSTEIVVDYLNDIPLTKRMNAK